MDGWEINERAIAAKDAGDPERELAILLEGVGTAVDTPYTYERAAMLLERHKRFQDALQVIGQGQANCRPSPTFDAMSRRRARLEERLGRPASGPVAPARPEHKRVKPGVDFPVVPVRDPWADMWAGQASPRTMASNGIATVTAGLGVSGGIELGAEFGRPLPFPARGNVDFVFVGGAIRYVDLDGSGQVNTWADCSMAQEVSRLSALVIDPNWVREAVRWCERIIAIKERGTTGAFGFQAGNDSWPFRQVAREVTGRSPLTLASESDLSSVSAPPTGHWMYCQNLERFVRDAVTPATVAVAPACVLYRGVARNDLFLHGLLDAMSQRGHTPITCVLPDIPSLRRFAACYATNQVMPDTSLLGLEEQMFTAPIKPARRGVVIRGEYGLSYYVSSGGVESSGADFEAALEFLESKFQVRLTPVEVLADPLLRGQLRVPPDDGGLTAGLPPETAEERAVRSQFERFYAGHTDVHRRLLEPVSISGAGTEATPKRRWWSR